MKDIRCPKCKKLLLKADTVVGEIKCKCGELVELKQISLSLQWKLHSLSLNKTN